MNEMNIAFQYSLRQEIPYQIKATKDYQEYKETLDRIDTLISASGIEKRLYEHYLNKRKENELTQKEKDRLWQHAQQVLRIVIIKRLREESVRDFHCILAESMVLQHVCRLREFGSNEVRIPGKTSINDYEKDLPEEVLKEMIHLLTQKTADEKNAEAIGLEKAISLDDVYLDTTCIEANIHYPVDWVLMRDAMRSLTKAIKTIRKRGLKRRMPQEPSVFMRDMNKLSIAMAQAGRNRNGRKKRKKVFREMKKLLNPVIGHAVRHRDLLEERWEETDLTRGEKNQIVARIDRIIGQMPEVIRQAHERIIGNRKVDNKEKILSLYEKDIHVIVRKKAGKDIEFGNSFTLVEQDDGLIIDYELYQGALSSDSAILQERTNVLDGIYGKGTIKSVTTDRGFNSTRNSIFLRKEKKIDYTCPRSPGALEALCAEEGFVAHQRRRAQTEGRIGVFKNVFLGRPLRSKGFAYRHRSIGWCVLAHNLWVLARLSLSNTRQTDFSYAA